MYIVFQCKKCGHYLYVECNDNFLKNIYKILDGECPECGEESYENWVLLGVEDNFPYES